MKIHITVFLIIAMILLSGCTSPSPGIDDIKDKRMCAQVITPAVSSTGECREFPTPCDVPEDWSVVESCKSSSSDSAGKCCLVAKGICQRMVDGTSGCETGQPVDCGSIICNPQVV